MEKPDKPRKLPKPRKSRKLADRKPSPKPARRASFTPVVLRMRRDGWTSEKQSDFIDALAESGCVTEACRRVGMSRASAYALLTRNDSSLFRAAWDAALDVGIGVLGDAARSRAINGVSRPVFYKGEQIGERIYFDERLTMFLLKTRDPERYGAWRDRFIFSTTNESKAQRLAAMSELAVMFAIENETGMTLIPRTPKPPGEPPTDPLAAPPWPPEKPLSDPT